MKFEVLIFLAIFVIAVAGFIAFFAAPPLQPFKTWVNPNTLIRDCQTKHQSPVGTNIIECNVK